MGSQKKKQKKKITYCKYKTIDSEKFGSCVLQHNFDKIDFGSYKDTLKYIRVNGGSICEKRPT